MRFVSALGLIVALLPSLAAAQSDSLTSSAAAAAARREQQQRAQPQTPTETPAPTGPHEPYVPELEGYWDGTLTKDGDSIAVTIRIENSGAAYVGSFESDALQLASVPLTNVSFTSPRAHWELGTAILRATFDGTVQGDFVSGDFSGPGGYGSFRLTRSGPRTPAIVTREVTWKNDDVTLSGTLLLPKTPGPHRAVLFLQDAGSEARWVRRYLAQKFAEHGVIALVYDKRGVGQSTGNWGTAYFGALADDAVGGVRLLQRLPEVDPNFVGVYGHGQGGALAPFVAEKADNLEFVIATSANALPPETLEQYGLESAMGIVALPAAEQADAHAYATAVVRYAYWRDNWDQLNGMMVAYKARPWYFEPPPFTDPYWTFSYNIQGYRPTYHWDDVHARVFLAYGQRDNRVPVQDSIDAITEAFRDGDDGRHAFRTWLCLECDHDFRVIGPNAGAWPRYSPEFADRLIDFVIYDRRQ